MSDVQKASCISSAKQHWILCANAVNQSIGIRREKRKKARLSVNFVTNAIFSGRKGEEHIQELDCL